MDTDYVDLAVAPLVDSPPATDEDVWSTDTESSEDECDVDYAGLRTPTDIRLWERFRHPNIMSWDVEKERTVNFTTPQPLSSFAVCVRPNTQLVAGMEVFVDDKKGTILGFSNGRVDVDVVELGKLLEEARYVDKKVKSGKGKRAKTTVEKVKVPARYGKSSTVTRSVLRDSVTPVQTTYWWVVTSGPYNRMCITSYLGDDGTRSTRFARYVDSSVNVKSIQVAPWVPSHWEHAHLLVSRVAPVLRRASVPYNMLLLFDFFFNDINNHVLHPKIARLKQQILTDATIDSFRHQRCIGVYKDAAGSEQYITRRDGLQVYSYTEDSDTYELTPKYTPGKLPCWRYDSTGGNAVTLTFEADNAAADVTEDGITWSSLAQWAPKTVAGEEVPASRLWARPKQLLYTLQPRLPIGLETSTFGLRIPKPQKDAPHYYAKLLEPGYVVLSMLLREIIEHQFEHAPKWQSVKMTTAEAYIKAMQWLIGTQERHLKTTGYTLFGMMPTFPMGTSSVVNGVWFLPHATYTLGALHMRMRFVSDAPSTQPTEDLLNDMIAKNRREVFASACPKGYNMAIQEKSLGTGIFIPQMSEQIYRLNTGPSVYPRCVRTLFEHLHHLGIDVKSVQSRNTVSMVLGSWQEAQKQLDDFRARNASISSSWAGKFAILTGTQTTDASVAQAKSQHRFQELIEYTVEVAIATVEVQLLRVAGNTQFTDDVEQRKIEEATAKVMARSLEDYANQHSDDETTIFTSLTKVLSDFSAYVSKSINSWFGGIAQFAAGATVLGLRLVRFLLRHPAMSLSLFKFVGDALGKVCNMCRDLFRDALGMTKTSGKVYRTKAKNSNVARKLGKALFGCEVLGSQNQGDIVYEQLDIDTQEWVELGPEEMAALWVKDSSFQDAQANLVWQGFTAAAEAMTGGVSLYQSVTDAASNAASVAGGSILQIINTSPTASEYVKDFAWLASKLNNTLSGILNALMGKVGQASDKAQAALNVAKNLPFGVGQSVNAIGSAVTTLVDLSASAGLSIKRIVNELCKHLPGMLYDTWIVYMKSIQAMKRVKALWHAISGPCQQAFQGASIDGRQIGACDSKLPIAFEIMMENAPYYALTMLATPNSLNYKAQPYQAQFNWMLRTTYALDKRPKMSAGASNASADAAEYLSKVASGSELHKKPRQTWYVRFKNALGELTEIELPVGASMLTQVLSQVRGTCDSADPENPCWVENAGLHNMLSTALIGVTAALGAVVSIQLVAGAVAAGAAAQTGSTVFTLYHAVKYVSERMISDEEASKLYKALEENYPSEAAKIKPEDMKNYIGGAAVAGGAGLAAGYLSAKAGLFVWDMLCDTLGGCNYPRAWSLQDVLAMDPSGNRYDIFKRTVNKYYNLFKAKDASVAKYGRLQDAWFQGTTDGGTPQSLNPIKVHIGDFDPYLQLNSWLLNIPRINQYIPPDAVGNFDMETTCAYFTGGFVGPSGNQKYHAPRSFPILWHALPEDDYEQSDVVMVSNTSARKKVMFKGGKHSAVLRDEEISQSWIATKYYGKRTSTTVVATAYQATADTPVWVDEDSAIDLSVKAGQGPTRPPTMNPSTSTIPVFDLPQLPVPAPLLVNEDKPGAFIGVQANTTPAGPVEVYSGTAVATVPGQNVVDKSPSFRLSDRMRRRHRPQLAGSNDLVELPDNAIAISANEGRDQRRAEARRRIDQNRRGAAGLQSFPAGAPETEFEVPEEEVFEKSA